MIVRCPIVLEYFFYSSRKGTDFEQILQLQVLSLLGLVSDKSKDRKHLDWIVMIWVLFSKLASSTLSQPNTRR